MPQSIMASFLPAQRYAIALLAMALCLCRCCTETDGRIELFFCMKASTSPPLRCRVIRKNLENNGTSVLNFVPNSGLSATKLTGTSSVAACYDSSVVGQTKLTLLATVDAQFITLIAKKAARRAGLYATDNHTSKFRAPIISLE